MAFGPRCQGAAARHLLAFGQRPCLLRAARRAAATLPVPKGQDGHKNVAVPKRPFQPPLLWVREDGRVPPPTLRPYNFADCSAGGIEAQELLRELRDCGCAVVGKAPEQQPELLQRLGEWLGGPPLQQLGLSETLGSGSDAAGVIGLGAGGELHTEDTFLPEPAAVLAVLADDFAASRVLRIVDGFAAAKALEATSPAAFHFLSSRQLLWRNGSSASGSGQLALAPVLRLHPDGTPDGLRWSLSDLSDLGPVARSEVQPHASALAALLASGRFERRLRLRPGELLLLDNRRMLLGADGPVSNRLPILRFGRSDVERALRLRGLLPPLDDFGITSPKVRVLRSDNLGYYAVAAAPVAEGERLFSVDLTVPDGRIKQEPSLYSIQVSEDQHMLPTLVPDELGGLIRYPCHMSNPSLKIQLSPGLVELVARHRIDVGQELGWNYCSTEWSMESPFTDTRTKAQIRGFRHLKQEERQWMQTEGLVVPHLERMLAQEA